MQADARLERTRAFVKIQDGCSFSCAFCVIPLVRGATRSRSARAVLAEIARRVGQGHREIVLTGVNLGCFRDREAGYALPRLVREAGSIPGLERLRLSSIEVNHLTTDLVAALRETPTAALHLHVPLQSGDDDVLRAMGRRYSAEQYLAKLDPLARLQRDRGRHRRLPGRGRGGLRAHARCDPRGGYHARARVPVLAATGNCDGSRRHRSYRGEEGAERAAARAFRRAVEAPLGIRLGTTDRVLVDRPGRGYGNDYTPWLLDGEVGQLLPARAVGVTEEGILAVAA